jgi:hypothetical protein
MHEVWAGQLIALAIAYWMRGRDRASLIAFVLAALIREHSILALGLVAIAAWRENRSAKMWGVAIAAVAAVYAAHIVAVVHHTPTGGITKGWGGLPGWAFIVSATRAHVLLVAAPYWVSALVAAVCVPALWVWREGRLVAVVVSAYAALFCVGARPDTWYWGLLILPLMPLGCIALARDALSSRLARKTQESAAALLV